MPLFDVPGWTVGAPPMAEPSTTTSKKRKRPASSVYEPHDLQAAQANIEKLIKQLDLPSPKDAPKVSNKKKGKAAADVSVSRFETEPRKSKKAKKAKTTVAEEEKKSPAPVKPTKTVDKAYSSPEDSKRVAKKRAPGSLSSQPAGLTALQKGMKESLDGARFRMINESLYKSDSLHAHQMMKEDPRVFQDYHAGFRHQVQLWPTNPVEHYISVLSKYPKKTVVADLGCGDAAMARSLVPEGLTILSFDLVSDDAFVVEADICDKIPLPGSEPTEKSEGDGQVVDVVVCALSLMGTNWPNCIREAWRILKPGGELKIAEVASRFTNIEEFQNLIGSTGFRLKSKVRTIFVFYRVFLTPRWLQDDSNSHFTLFEFRKAASKGKSEKEWENNWHGTRLPHSLYISDVLKSTSTVMTTAKVNVLSHPIVNAELSKLRQLTTGPKEFREGIHQISLVLGIEATRTLEESTFEGVTPVGPFVGTVIKPRIGLTPILRAGLGMTDALLTLFPNAPVYHLGLFREKVTLQPVEYQVFLLDPLIATGGTACAALAMIVDWGIPGEMASVY
ncbi:hypothetical protein C0991_005923 [Blastosporella zonata]|nr:hypothetical protein C0991_005923 [Blastosporella zonata]